MEEALRTLDLRRVAALRERVDDAGLGEGTRVRLLASRQRGAKSSGMGKKKNDTVWSSHLYSII